MRLFVGRGVHELIERVFIYSDRTLTDFMNARRQDIMRRIIVFSLLHVAPLHIKYCMRLYNCVWEMFCPPRRGWTQCND